VSVDTRRTRAALVLDQLALWLAAAVLAGFLHLALARAIRLGFSVVRWGWESRDLIWRVPIGYGIVFVPVAALLVLLALILGRRFPTRVPVWVWITLVLFSLLLLFPQINGYASFVLAGGLALRIVPLVTRQPELLLRSARVIGVVGGAAALLTAAVLPRIRSAAERNTIAQLPAAPEGAPNVLLLILDTVRADYLSVYNVAEKTSPRLAEWAQRGTVFDQSYSTSSWTTPSHASFFTGQYPSAHRASYTVRLGEQHLTLAEVLKERGWATAGITANYAATPIESGLAQGFIHYADLKNTLKEVTKSTTITQAQNVVRFINALRSGQSVSHAIGRFFSADFSPRFTDHAHDTKTAPEVRAQFSAWLDELPKGRPFFAFLNMYDAHYPYISPQPYTSMFKTGNGPADLYRGSIRYLDGQVDSLFRDLERRGILDNTIVIVTSDHGEQFGEHEQWAHANSLYRQVLHVPLVVIYPKAVPAGVRASQQVTGRDIPATVLDLLAVPRDSAIGGTSLAALWRDSTARASDVVAEVDQNMRAVKHLMNSYGPMKAIFDDSLHVVRDGTGIYEAYRYRQDPAEVQDLVAAARDPAAFKALLEFAVRRHRLFWPARVYREPMAADPEEIGQ
jgi:arylsulfatase A-like enzyme